MRDGRIKQSPSVPGECFKKLVPDVATCSNGEMGVWAYENINSHLLVFGSVLSQTAHLHTHTHNLVKKNISNPKII